MPLLSYKKSLQPRGLKAFGFCQALFRRFLYQLDDVLVFGEPVAADVVAGADYDFAFVGFDLEAVAEVLEVVFVGAVKVRDVEVVEGIAELREGFFAEVVVHVPCEEEHVWVGFEDWLKARGIYNIARREMVEDEGGHAVGGRLGEGRVKPVELSFTEIALCSAVFLRAHYDEIVAVYYSVVIDFVNFAAREFVVVIDELLLRVGVAAVAPDVVVAYCD